MKPIVCLHLDSQPSPNGRFDFPLPTTESDGRAVRPSDKNGGHLTSLPSPTQ